MSRHPHRLICLIIICLAHSVPALAEVPRSELVTAVLRQPLPAEELLISTDNEQFIIDGPTFTYRVDRKSGAIQSLAIRRNGKTIVSSRAPAQVYIDSYRLASGTAEGETVVRSRTAQLVVVQTNGLVQPNAAKNPPLPYELTSTFFNDGVVVSELTLRPDKNMSLREGIRHELEVEGPLDWHLHKSHDRHDGETPGHNPPLPATGETARFTTKTSCLQALSHRAAIAIFTDQGASYVSPAGAETASLHVKQRSGDKTRTVLTQRIATIGSEGEPFVLPAGQDFRFRFGISVAPNRHPHPRRNDLRHFCWIGDGNNPYPTDAEIEKVAQLGFTVFQMHRIGLLGQPRPPAGELERVIKKVHDCGMLIVWLTLPDLLDAHSPRVQQMLTDGSWSRWEASSYGGRYTATMDPYVDYYSTCVGAPNGLDDYHLECTEEMLDRYDVDGIYVDDNITQAHACHHPELHGHPREEYDCLIELHRVNWRRRQLLRERRPHALLIDHCSTGLVLPVISSFDVHCYGEGHGISSLADYWNFYGAIKYMHAHGNLWPGDSEAVRFPTRAAYNLDLLTGGGQYSYIDWRLLPEKMPYADGVAPHEVEFVKTFNLSQYFFGMYESRPYFFATSGHLFSTSKQTTAATVYRNEVWQDYLVPVANMAEAHVVDSVTIHDGEKLGIDPDRTYAVYDVIANTCQSVPGATIDRALQGLQIPAEGLRLLYLRPQPEAAPFHLWGGKRIEERWDPEQRRLTVTLQGPPELKSRVVFAVQDQGIENVTMNGQPLDFFYDADQSLAHGITTFAQAPIIVEAVFRKLPNSTLPKKALRPLPVNNIYRE